MHDPLSAYWKKRDFGVTPEPRGATAKTGKALAYVIQKHAARSLHYDFRLELGGTLKSWAVPKGPSLDPTQKRMAVHVEDHPLSYGDFEGTIPPNQYGSGSVIVWDRGTWEAIGDAEEGYRSGKLKFRLDGEKLHGLWALVKMRGRGDERQEPWLLIKEQDDAARPASGYSVVDALPDSVISGRPVGPGPGSAAEARPAAKTAESAATKVAARRTAAKPENVAARKSRPAAKAAAAEKTAAPRKAATATAKAPAPKR